MSIYNQVTVIIPSYKPDEKLLSTLDSILKQGFLDILVVDDGGGEKYAPVFDKVKEYPHCTVLHHPVNRGKGAALKTAFAYYLANRPDSVGVVTADADGQHLAKDIDKVASAMAESHTVVLGCRDFSEPHVPPRSKSGNNISRFLFRSLLGSRISDTQTGLRAIPREYLPAVASAEGDRYEYETHMLFLIAREKIPMTEQTIETVYLDNNASSHVRVLHDSARIYAKPLRFLGHSLLSAAADTLLFLLLFTLMNRILITHPLTILAALAGARILSGTLNYFLNAMHVFQPGRPGFASWIRYTGLAAVFFCITAVCLALYPLYSFETQGAILGSVILVKSVAGILLFFPSFRIQHNHVFTKRTNTNKM